MVLFLYLDHLHLPMVQPVWPWVIGFLMNYGHALTLFKDEYECVSPWLGCFEIYSQPKTHLTFKKSSELTVRKKD
jgi:hypothetical protein